VRPRRSDTALLLPRFSETRRTDRAAAAAAAASSVQEANHVGSTGEEEVEEEWLEINSPSVAGEKVKICSYGTFLPVMCSAQVSAITLRRQT